MARVAHEITPASKARPKILVSFTPDGPDHAPWLAETLATLTSAACQELREQGADVEVVDASKARHSPMDMDGILILGGGDVDPSMYGKPCGLDGLYGVSRDADQFETSLVREATATGTPVFGICRGMQVINVALGGDLIADLGSESIHKSHSQDDKMVDHPVLLVDTSNLAASLGVTSLQVRSSHHQALNRIGRGLKVAATASDGVIEAVEHEAAWVLGIQWHPEDAGSPEGQLRDLLKMFLNRCRRPVLSA
jgi:putative glutamine amidotransferase